MFHHISDAAVTRSATKTNIYFIAGTRVDDYPELHEFLSRRSVLWKTPENAKLVLSDETLLKKLGSYSITLDTNHCTIKCQLDQSVRNQVSARPVGALSSVS